MRLPFYKEKKFIFYTASTFCLFFLTSCRVPEEWTEKFNDHVGPVFGVRIEYTDNKPQPASSPKVNPEAHLSLNAEFIKEVYKVVLERNCTEEEFHRWMNVLDQGGSYEGIYNGLAHNEEYRAKEKGAALPEALRLYAQIMAQFALDMKYDPLKNKLSPVEPIPGQRPEEAAPQGKPTDAEKNILIGEMATKAVNKSLYTLKREAAAEALKLMEYKKEYKEKYATWFGRFAQWSSSRKVDFGIDARNKNDEYFHYKWALDSTEDRIRWEVLNRIHRIFNAIQTK